MKTFFSSMVRKVYRKSDSSEDASQRQGQIITQVQRDGSANTHGGQNKESKSTFSFMNFICSCLVEKKFEMNNNTQTASAPLLTRKALPVPAQKDSDRNKKVLVLDLDETLVHSSFTHMEGADFELNIRVQNAPFTVYVKKRP